MKGALGFAAASVGCGVLAFDDWSWRVRIGFATLAVMFATVAILEVVL